MTRDAARSSRRDSIAIIAVSIRPRHPHLAAATAITVSTAKTVSAATTVSAAANIAHHHRHRWRRRQRHRRRRHRHRTLGRPPSGRGPLGCLAWTLWIRLPAGGVRLAGEEGARAA